MQPMQPIAVLLWLALSVGPGPTQPAPAARSSGGPSAAQPLPFQLRSQLVARDFRQLAQTLATKQAAFERSVLEEDALWEAFLSFSIPDPSLAQPLDDWVSASPDSWVPRLARAYYLQKLGFTERGNARLDRVPSPQIQAMARSLDRAETDFRAALSRNAKLSMAHEGLMGIGEYRGDRAMVEAAFQSALRIAPASFQIRAARLHSLRPAWGGSYAEMMAVAGDAQRYLEQNPRLAALPGYVAVDQSDEALRAGDAAKALQLVSQAISTAPHPALYSARGRLHYRDSRYAEALADFERAIELGPRGWWYVDIRLAKSHMYRGESLAHLDRYDEAIEALELATRIDPYADEFLVGAVDMVRQLRDSRKRR
jgi:tetratricopeptide (TPR) repeat protein